MFKCSDKNSYIEFFKTKRPLEGWRLRNRKYYDRGRVQKSGPPHGRSLIAHRGEKVLPKTLATLLHN